MAMFLFINQRKCYRPGAGTSPAYEAGNSTNWHLDSWNDGTPGKFVQIYIMQVGFVIIQYTLRHSSLQVKPKPYFIIVSMSFVYCSGSGSGSSRTAPSNRTHSPEETFLCLWVGADGLHCDDLIIGCNLNTHLRQVHGVHGADKDRMLCRWRSCYKELNKENLARHIEETHLGIVHTCTGCGAKFSRKDTLNKHRVTFQH